MSGCYDVIMTSPGLKPPVMSSCKLPGTYWASLLGTPVDTQRHPSTSSQNLVIQQDCHRRHDTNGDVTETSPEQPTQRNSNTYRSSPRDTRPGPPSGRTGTSVLPTAGGGPGTTVTITVTTGTGAIRRLSCSQHTLQVTTAQPHTAALQRDLIQVKPLREAQHLYGHPRTTRERQIKQESHSPLLNKAQCSEMHYYDDIHMLPGVEGGDS